MKFCRICLAIAVLSLFSSLNADDTKKPTSAQQCDKCPTTATKCADGKCVQGKCEGEKCCAAGKCETGTSKCCADGKCAHGKCEAEKCCAEGKCEGAACCHSLASAKEKLPKLIYKVGAETTCCSASAEALAEKSKEAVQFVVAEKSYTCKNEAFSALVAETEKFVESFVTVSKCEASGKSVVAGKSFDCCVEAGSKAELVKAAVKEVKVSYKVGDDEACCAGSAAALAKKTNKPIQFVVNGEATECELTSRLNLATAKYLAAVKALTKVEQTTNATSTNKSDS
jgi:hypothetical protein